MLIRGVEVSSKEVVDHTGSPRQHVLLGRTERETGTDRAGSTAQRWVLFLFFSKTGANLSESSSTTPTSQTVLRTSQAEMKANSDTSFLG